MESDQELSSKSGSDDELGEERKMSDDELDDMNLSDEDESNPRSTGEGYNIPIRTSSDDQIKFRKDHNSSSSAYSSDYSQHNSDSESEPTPRKRKSKKSGNDSGKQRQPRQRKSKEEKANQDAIDELPEDIREILKPQKTKYVENEREEELLFRAQEIINDMDEALTRDADAHNRGNNHSFERIKFLQRLDRLTANEQLLEALYQKSLLRYCEAYLLPFKDGQFPLYSIRMDVIKILEKIPTRYISSEDLKSDGNSQLIQVLQNPPESHDEHLADCPLCKRSRDLVEKWKRSILGADENTSITEERREKMKQSSAAIAYLPAFNPKQQNINKHMSKDKRSTQMPTNRTIQEVFINLPHMKKKHVPESTSKRMTSEPT